MRRNVKYVARVPDAEPGEAGLGALLASDFRPSGWQVGRAGEHARSRTHAG